MIDERIGARESQSAGCLVQPPDARKVAMQVIEVAAGIIAHEGRYLIARRKAGTHLGGLWEFPGANGKQARRWRNVCIGSCGRS